MAKLWVLALFLAAFSIPVANASSRDTCLTGWIKIPQNLTLSQNSMSGNCGYMVANLKKKCLSTNCDESACCYNACVSNGAGCFCDPNSLEVITSLRVSGSLISLGNQMTSTPCLLGNLIMPSKKNCPAAGTRSTGTPCSRAAPEPETAACTSAQKANRVLNMGKLLNLLNIPSVGSNAINAGVEGVMTKDGAVAIALGTPVTGTTAVTNLIKSKLSVLEPAVQKSARVSMSEPHSNGRSVSVRFNVTGTDVVGKAFSLGPFVAFAVFDPCSSRIKSMYLNNAVSVATVRSLSTKARFPAGSVSPASAAIVPTTTALNETVPARRLLGILDTFGISTKSLEDWFVKTFNGVLQSDLVQSFPIPITSNCETSTLNAMYFCSAAAGKGSSTAEDSSGLSTACDVLCAGGAFDAIGSGACEAGTAVACQSCKAGCAIGSIFTKCSCKSACHIDCDTNCKGSCKDSFGSIGVSYDYAVEYVKGLGDVHLTSATVSKVQEYQAGVAPLSITFDAAAQLTGAEVKVSVGAKLTPNVVGDVNIHMSYPITGTVYANSVRIEAYHDCVATKSGKIKIALADFKLAGDWINSRVLTESFGEWTSFFGFNWVASVVNPIAGAINGALSPVISSAIKGAIDGVVDSVDLGVVPCSIYD